MTTSPTQRPSLQSELVSRDPISEQTFAYLTQRAINRYYDFVLRKFLKAEREGRLSRAELARKIDIDPAQLSRILGAPGNWTIATIVRLLAGISAEELEPASRSFLNRPPQNYTQQDILWGVSETFQSADQIKSHELTPTKTTTGQSEFKPEKPYYAETAAG